jgi:hypothetical protein
MGRAVFTIIAGMTALLMWAKADIFKSSASIATDENCLRRPTQD